MPKQPFFAQQNKKPTRSVSSYVHKGKVTQGAYNTYSSHKNKQSSNSFQSPEQTSIHIGHTSILERTSIYVLSLYLIGGLRFPGLVCGFWGHCGPVKEKKDSASLVRVFYSM